MDDLNNPNKVYLEPERVTLPIRLAMNWAYRGIQPPDLYRQTFRRAWLILRAYDQIMGQEADPGPDRKRDEEDEGQ